MIIAKFSRKISPLRRQQNPNHNQHTEDGKLPAISLEDVSTIKSYSASPEPPQEDRNPRKSTKGSRFRRHLSPFGFDKHSSKESQRRRSFDLASLSIPDRIDRAPSPQTTRPSTSNSVSTNYSTASSSFGSGFFPSPEKTRTSRSASPFRKFRSKPASLVDVGINNKPKINSPLSSPSQFPAEPSEFSKLFHEQNPTKITCGFEDIFLPEGINDNQELYHPRNLEYRFQHEASLMLHDKLQEQLKDRPGDVVLEFFDVSVYKEDIDNLQPGYWLNDNNISFVYEYLERLEIMRAGLETQIFLVRPSMAFLLAHGDPNEVSEFLPDFKNASFIFLPINDNDNVEIVSGNHWSLLVVAVEVGKAIYYDTIGESNIYTARNVAHNLGVVLKQKLKFVAAPTPQQSNGSDCGVYVCEITSLLLRRLLYTGGTIDLDVSKLTFVADAGRTFIFTAILQLIAMFGHRIRDSPEG